MNSDLWKDIITLQENWIGPCTGMRFEWQVTTAGGQTLDSPLSVFTEYPECIHGVSHILLSPSHYLNSTEYYRDPQDTSEGRKAYVIIGLILQNILS